VIRKTSYEVDVGKQNERASRCRRASRIVASLEWSWWSTARRSRVPRLAPQRPPRCHEPNEAAAAAMTAGRRGGPALSGSGPARRDEERPGP